MRLNDFWRLTVCGLLLLVPSFGAWSEEAGTQSGWLELVKGAKEANLGAELVEIKSGDTPDSQTITLAIPKKAIANPNQIEEVVVVGQRPEKPQKPEPLDVSFEWAGDYDSDNYGLVIRLRRNTNWPIRLYFNSSPGFVR